MKITKTPSGKYTCQAIITDLDGKRHFKRFTCKTRDECRQLANEYLNAHRVYTESLIFRDALERYLDRAERVLSPSTMAAYKSNQRTLLKDYERFCALSCDRITERDVQLVVDDMVSKGKTVKTVKNRLGLISAVLTAEHCKMPSVTLPKAKAVSYAIPDAETVSRVSGACVGRFERMAVPFTLAVFGLRRGEICAVTSEDLTGSVLHVRHAIVTGEHSLSDQPPKTAQSVRDVVIPPETAAAIRETGRAWSGTPKSLSDTWPHLLRAAGVEYFRFHDCRHFFVSYCHEILKLSDAQIMKLGGWKTNYVMVTHYRHALSDQSEAVAESLASVLCGSSCGGNSEIARG